MCLWRIFILFLHDPLPSDQPLECTLGADTSPFINERPAQAHHRAWISCCAIVDGSQEIGVDDPALTGLPAHEIVGQLLNLTLR